MSSGPVSAWQALYQLHQLPPSPTVYSFLNNSLTKVQLTRQCVLSVCSSVVSVTPPAVRPSPQSPLDHHPGWTLEPLTINFRFTISPSSWQLLICLLFLFSLCPSVALDNELCGQKHKLYPVLQGPRQTCRQQCRAGASLPSGLCLHFFLMN